MGEEHKYRLGDRLRCRCIVWGAGGNMADLENQSGSSKNDKKWRNARFALEVAIRACETC